MTGRPSTYTKQIADEVCDWVANGRSLRSYCAQDDKPHFSTIYKWLMDQEDFADAFAHARETQAHNDADRINHVTELLEMGVLAPDVARVITDAMKWTAAKRASRAYGEKVQVDATSNAPLIITWANGDSVK